MLYHKKAALPFAVLHTIYLLPSRCSIRQRLASFSFVLFLGTVCLEQTNQSQTRLRTCSLLFSISAFTDTLYGSFLMTAVKSTSCCSCSHELQQSVGCFSLDDTARQSTNDLASLTMFEHRSTHVTSRWTAQLHWRLRERCPICLAPRRCPWPLHASHIFAQTFEHAAW